MSRVRKGQDFEQIHCEFTKTDIEKLKVKQVFNKKWIVLKTLGWRGEACCYDVCDKKAQKFGTLYLEIAAEGMNSVADQLEFSHKQYSLGNSHRFTTAIDCGILNNHVFYMVLQHRPGASLKSVLECVPAVLSPTTVAFIAIDLISLVEILASTGYVLRNFDANQWKLNAKSRQLCLADFSDIVVISDKRYCPINQLHFKSADRIDLHWNSENLAYAPMSFIVDGPYHRMSELDLMEVMLYVIYELAYGKLPWKNSKKSQRTLEMKKEFMDSLPELVVKAETREAETLEANLHVCLQNMLEYIKEGVKKQERLMSLPVRDGAWCPNGARAGALISTVKYREIIEDFHKVVVSGRPSWSIHWRDVMLDWETRFEHTEKSLKLLEKIEIRQRAMDILKETNRLAGTRMHYKIMKEHANAEMQQNAVAIEEYLAEQQEEVKETTKRETRREKKMRMDKEKEAEKVEEIESTSKSSQSSRPRRQGLQKVKKEIQKDKKMENDDAEVEKAEEDSDDKSPIKTEEPDGFDVPDVVQTSEIQNHREEEVMEDDEDDWEIKIEEPDDFDE